MAQQDQVQIKKFLKDKINLSTLHFMRFL